jgi:hypothetical protein
MLSAQVGPGRNQVTGVLRRREVKLPRICLPLAAVGLAGLIAACAGPRSAQAPAATALPATGSPATASPATASPLAGTLAGHLYGVGGAAPGAPRPWPGTVTLTGPGVRRDIQVGASGSFSVLVPAGTYTVAGRSPRYGSGAGVCRAAGPATVISGHRTRADVLCQMK